MIPAELWAQIAAVVVPDGEDGCSSAEQPVSSAQVRTDRLRDVANIRSVRLQMSSGRPPAYIPTTVPRRRRRQQLQPTQINMIQHPPHRSDPGGPRQCDRAVIVNSCRCHQ